VEGAGTSIKGWNPHEDLMTRTRRWFRFPSRTPNDVRDDVRDEIGFHLDMRTEHLIGEGVAPQEARAQAAREFGDLSRSSASLRRQDEQLERQRTFTRLWSDARHDTIYGLRLLVRDRGFSSAAVLTLAVAIGGNTAVFSVVNAMFFQPLAIHAPEEMARIHPGQSTVSWPNLQDFRERNAVFTDVVAQGNTAMTLSGDPLSIRVWASLVSADYFSVLGAAPLIGRPLHADERSANVVILSERLWRTRYSGSPSILGQTIRLDGRPYEVVGVMPRTFRGVAPAGLTRDLWVPFDASGAHRGIAADRTAARFEAFGRLKPGVSVEAAAGAMKVLGAQMASEFPETNKTYASMQIFGAHGLGLFQGFGKTLMPVFVFIGFLTIVTGLVVVIGCVNLAGLLLARAAARRQEIAVRLALGAGRGRVVRQLLTESVVLALVGGGSGLALGMLLTTAASAAVAHLPIPIELNMPLDRRVLAYTFGVSMMCGLLFGVVPARRASRLQLVDSLKTDGGGGRARQRFRQALLVTQVAVSALLLFWSGLFARSLMHADRVDPGFDSSGVLLAEIRVADDRPGAHERAEAAFVELHTRVRELPGVDAVGWSSVVPLALLGNERFRVSPREAAQGTPGTWVNASRLSPGWFGAVHIAIVAGRDFTWLDRQGSLPVAVVNETLARQFWNGNAVGRQLRYGAGTVDIVGVVRDSKYWTLGEAISPMVYLPWRQSPSFSNPDPTLHVRTSNPRVVSERIRELVQGVVPEASPAMKPMRDAVAVATVPARIGAIVMGAFGLLGGCLAMLGIYGLISYILAQRWREIAIRRAIGASTHHIVRVVVGSSAVLALGGLTAGVAAGALTAPLLGGLLVGVSPRDPLVVTATALMILGTVVVASAPLAFRAARIDPLAALKAD
jgi:predicted permease